MFYGALAVFLLVFQNKNVQSSEISELCMYLNQDAGILHCDQLGLHEPPAGYWPNITYIDISGNSISHLWPDSFDGFPDLEILSLSSNPLQEIDLRIFVRLKKLENLYLQKCRISNIIPLDNGQTMTNLESLYFDDNILTRIPTNLLNGFTNKTLTLGLSGNPLKFPSKTPFLASNYLNVLDLSYLDASGVSAETFEALPKLEILVMANSSLIDISNKFTYLPSLRHLFLLYNPFSEIRTGFLSTDQRLESIDVSFSSLESIEETAVKGRTENAVLRFDGTPMACHRQYENILAHFAKVEGKCLSKMSPFFLN